MSTSIKTQKFSYGFVKQCLNKDKYTLVTLCLTIMQDRITKQSPITVLPSGHWIILYTGSTDWQMLEHINVRQGVLSF